MKYSEQAITFDCAQETLVGILAVPEEAVAATGVVVIVGGPQYRAGSHRQFVLLSRALAAAGFAVLRFDYRGMGDSTGQQRDFLGVNPDIGAAIDAMQRQLPAVQRVALWGLCDGASAALLYCHDSRDPRISGLCLLNPWVRSEASLAKTQVKHYYTRRLREKEFWVKLLRGKVAATAASELVRSLKKMLSARKPVTQSQQIGPFQTRMGVAWTQFKGPICLILSADDYTAKEFLEYVATDTAWETALSKPQVTRHTCAEADHTFSHHSDRANVEALTIRFLRE